MKRVKKIFHIFFVLMFSIPAGAGDVQQLLKANWKCDPQYVQDGEIEIIVERLREDPRHPAVCLYSKQQNSFLWRTVEYEKFRIKLTPIEGAAARPFYVDIPAGGLDSVNRLISTGPPRRELPVDKVLKYGIIVEFLDENGNVIHTIDPHTAIHTSK